MVSAILAAANNAHPQWWRDPSLRRLNFHLAVLQLGTIISGYDGSLMNGFFAIDDFLDDMGQPDANIQGLLIAAISLGTMIGLAFAGIWADKRGRKEPQQAGCLLIIAGALMQTFSVSRWSFFGSRLIVGCGSGLLVITGSVHVIELAHPRQAPQHAALFGANWFVGAIIAAWLTYGSLSIQSNWNWRLPALVQAPISFVQLVLLFWVPQSPRWLISKGRTDEARGILVKYHANGLQSDEMVLRELHEIQIAVEEAQEHKSNSIRQFFKTRGNIKRLIILVWVALFIQWAGNGIISYYLTPILESSGIETAEQQQGINGGLQIWSWFWALFAAFTCSRFKRRTLWLASYAGMLVSYVIFTALNATFVNTGTKSIGIASIPFLFLFNASYSLAGTALCYLYCLEILPQGLRAQGMALMLIIDYGAIFFNSYVNPVALEAMSWKYFLVYIAILACCIAFIWFYLPETSGLSIEEAAMVCDGAEAKEKLEYLAMDRAAVGQEKAEMQAIEGAEKVNGDLAVVMELR